jgi:ribosomal protein L11 methyltransferase
MREALYRVAVRADAGLEEQVRARLLDLVPDGLEEVVRPGGLEIAAYVPAAGVERVRQAFPSASSTEVAPGWEDGWRSFHRPVAVAGLWIGPPWEPAPAGVPTVVIDPGRAFGTGSHPTTRLCIRLLATVARGSLLDVGSGSGVLAIAGARLGFAPVVAVDVDPVAVEATRANAEANGVPVEAVVVDALTAPLTRTDVAVANVLLRPVEEILARLDAREAVTSGYLAGERPAHDGWAHVDTLEHDGWVADRFTRA